jgi:hypothetical protein
MTAWLQHLQFASIWIWDFVLKNWPALAALIISLFALFYSRRSATAAETANRHSERAAEAADISSKITKAIYEDDAKRLKARAYWALYRIHNILDPPKRTIDPQKFDLLPVQDYLSTYGQTLDPGQREVLRIAINGVELLIAHSTEHPEITKIHRAVMDAAMILREEFMEPLTEDIDKSSS